MPVGFRKPASSAAPLPLPPTPLPATVLTRPDADTWRMRWLLRSARYQPPPSRTMPLGSLNCALPAAPSLNPGTPLPTVLSNVATAVGAHLPPLQTSPVVQPLPSSQALLCTVNRQLPVLTSHAPSVQGLPSSQSTAVPFLHDPPLQVPVTMHLSTCAHGLVFGVKTQWPVLQPSSVQPFLSSHSRAGYA